MKSLILTLALLSSPVLAQQQPVQEVCINPHTLHFFFVRVEEEVSLVTQALSCEGEILMWEIDAKKIEVITLPKEHVTI